jgi:flagellar biosynthesis chaperone FliJ
MNYYQLLSAIQDYTENQFPDTYLSNGTVVSSTQQINRFIEQAELRIYNSVQLPSLRKNVIGNVTTSNPYLHALMIFYHLSL